VAVWLFKKEFPKFKIKKNHKKSFLLALSFGIFISGFIVISYNLFLKSILLENLTGIKAKIDLFGLANNFILFSIILSVFNAAFEEYYWRWFVFRGLTIKLDWKIAMLLSSIGFALHHFVVLTEFFILPIAFFLGIMVMIGGCFMAYIYKRSNSILGAWFLHFLIDITIMLLVYKLL